MEHYYKGYMLKRNGTKDTPWNIYKKKYCKFQNEEYWEWDGYGRTFKESKKSIDASCKEQDDAN